MKAAVRVQETRVFATQMASAWWAAFSHHHAPTGRLTVVTATIGGAVVDVTCEDDDHARWLAAHMEAQGIPKSALKVIRVADKDAAA